MCHGGILLDRGGVSTQQGCRWKPFWKGFVKTPRCPLRVKVILVWLSLVSVICRLQYGFRGSGSVVSNALGPIYKVPWKRQAGRIESGKSARMEYSSSFFPLLRVPKLGPLTRLYCRHSLSCISVNFTWQVAWSLFDRFHSISCTYIVMSLLLSIIVLRIWLLSFIIALQFPSITEYCYYDMYNILVILILN